eukprot:SAG11_NODE_29753_length_307_cov_1.442308_1_plen_31_part_10
MRGAFVADAFVAIIISAKMLVVEDVIIKCVW